MEKILRGVARFNSQLRKAYLDQIDQCSKQIVKPLTVFITCMDCRMQPSSMIHSKAGEVFFIRNPGNMVPHFSTLGDNVTAVGAGLELTCIMNGVGNIVVCGHSDCKAVNSLYNQRNSCCDVMHTHKTGSPLQNWLAGYGKKTIENFTDLFSEDMQDQSTRGETILGGFKFNFGRDEFTCAIDPENRFGIEDKMSQFHCLQQASHVASYPILQPYIARREVKVHAMWFDIHAAQMYVFSPNKGFFIPIEESMLDDMLKEVES